jgi:hypothetical protein
MKPPRFGGMESMVVEALQKDLPPPTYIKSANQAADVHVMNYHSIAKSVKTDDHDNVSASTAHSALELVRNSFDVFSAKYTIVVSKQISQSIINDLDLSWELTVLSDILR